MPKKNCTIINKPKNKKAAIWKYFDFVKFMALLDTSSLYFSRADMLADPHEGSYKLNIRGNNKNSDRPNLIGARANIYLNCWHENEYESAAMWDLYLKSDEGIAIKTTFEKLNKCLNKHSSNRIYLSKVKYIDYQKSGLPKNNNLAPFIYKRKSFEHENEIRALIFEPKKIKGSGILVPVDISLLIDKIYVAPTAQKWIYGLVQSIIKKYNLDKEVIKSDLFDDPIL